MIPVVRRAEEVAEVWSAAEARRHTANVMACDTPEARREYLSKNALWTQLIALFEHWSHGKCWYTEAKPRRHGGLFEIDHFRPKSVACDPWHNHRTWAGYLWLAYEWENFRLAAPVANRLGYDLDGVGSGKGTYFPLRSESAPYATCAAELEAERPYVLLIDPCNPDDVSDISFREDGLVTCTVSNDSYRQERVATTVNVYNLNDAGLCESRRSVWLRCSGLSEEIKVLEKLERLSGPGPLSAMLQGKKSELTRMFRDDEEFAGTARAFARRQDDAWVRVASQNVPAPVYVPFRETSKPPPANDNAPGSSRIPGAMEQIAFPFLSETVVPKKPRPKKAAPKKPPKGAAQGQASTVPSVVVSPSGTEREPDEGVGDA